MERFEKKEKKYYHMKQAFGQKELHEREKLCTRLEPPQCQSGCPIHIDVRALCKAVSNGDYTKGYAIIKSASPFVNLIAKKCTAPCEDSCVLKEKGSIKINNIEKACAVFGHDKQKSKFLLPRKTKKAAVFGNDLFALACCAELGQKGYEVKYFCENPRNILLNLGLDESEVSADLALFDNLKVNFEYHAEINYTLLEKTALEYAALCVSSEISRLFDGKEIPNVFTGYDSSSLIDILCSAKTISLNADRFMQGVQTEHGRQREGAYTSKLFVSEDDINKAKIYTNVFEEGIEKEAVQNEASRCIQCECKECIKACVFLQHYKSDPRKTIREIYNNASIVMGDHHANNMINSCSECGQCAYTCPNNFDLSEICRIARQSMVETGKMPPSTHEFALLDLNFSNEDAFLALNQPGYEKCKYVFFPGCQMSSVSPKTVESAYLDLCERLEGGVALILGCCGAIADWAGNDEFLNEAVEKIAHTLEKLNNPELIVSCPTCMKIFENIAGIKSKAIWDILNEIGLPENIEKQSGFVSVHDSCSARGNEKIHDSVRNLIQATGRNIVDTKYNRNETPCCGYGGLTVYANPALAVKMSDFIVGDTEKTYVSYCMACRDRFARSGAKSLHILELIYGEDNSCPDISGKRKNRMLLKAGLLKNVWGYDFMIKEYNFKVHISGETAAQMDERMILIDDIYKVFENMRENGNSIFDQKTGFLITTSRLGNVTFWVKYNEAPDGYILKSAYSHRMTVEV